ncbi:UDP-glycosyltransferase UGT5-like [Culicoides brevitarsis]|uniref:UDP-glycosyltransferase UGT5-like n=1 Tax=Culicoides brevitarsis TaxID=469753 RepID=UPI00307C6302
MISGINFVAKFVVIAFLLTIIHESSSYKIFCIFSTPAASHQIVFRSYSKALAEAGHEVVVATTHPVKNPHPNITQIDWSDVNSYWQKQLDMTKTSKYGLLGIIYKYMGGLSHVLDQELSHPAIQDILKYPKKHNFDVVVAESQFVSMLEFAKFLKTPLIVISSSDPSYLEHEAVGNYVHAVAAPLRTSATYGPMSFFERFKSKSMDFIFFAMGFFMEGFYTDVLHKHFSEVRSPAEIVRDIDLLLINVNPAFGYIRPITPKTINLGFMHITEPKKLPNDLQSYLDNSQYGVIYCSFGTNILPEKFDKQKVRSILDAFGRLKYDVLYKYGNDTIENLPVNVKLVKWAPQQDLLAHKNIKLFITHGGQHSIEESIYREIPMIAVPFFGDQFTNAKRVEARGLGKRLEIEKITSDILEETINEIIENPMYKENVAKLGQIVKDEPMKPTEKAVFWTEYVIRHKGAKHLEYPGVHVPTYQLYYLDVIAAYLVILIILTIVLYFFTKLISKVIHKIILIVNKIFFQCNSDKKDIKKD